MIKAALIDMDGVLYDSMPLHAKAWNRLTRDLGWKIPVEEFFLYEGMTGEATINYLAKREQGIEFSTEECRRLYGLKTEYFKQLGSPEIMPGAKETISLLQDKKIQCILVTGSGQMSLLERVINDFGNAFSLDKMVTSRNVNRGKPHPEPYLKGATFAGAEIQQCIAIDNAPLGVKSAVGAGCYTIGVTTGPIPSDKLIAEGADIVVESMQACHDYLINYLNYN